MFVHVQHAAELCPRVLVKTVDSDVVVALGAFHRIHDLQKLWLKFGVGKHLNYAYIPIHEIATSIGTQISTAFPFFPRIQWL
jgi:hypothetical protein